MENKKIIENIILHKKEKTYEGIYYDNMIKDLVFDYNSDNDDDIIYLNNASLTDTKLDNNLYSYGYVMNKNAPYRSNFMNLLKTKFNNNQVTEDMLLFINSATYWFDRDHKLNSFDLIVYPDSRNNKLVREIISSFNALLRSGEALTYYEIMKNLPEDVIFDEQLFKSNNMDLSATEQQAYIDSIIQNKNNLEYFSIRKASKQQVENREYFRNFFNFNNAEAEEAIYKLQNTNWILVVDDTFTTGSTIREIIRNIREINDICQIYIFTLVKGYDGNLDRYV